jgi:tRNA-2-methylthio-N6-dimethylallyladenosine synthase
MDIPATLLYTILSAIAEAALAPAPDPQMMNEAQALMARKLFIRTFGCQMNEYDSDKMADVLAAIRRNRQDRHPRRRRHHPLQHLLGAREGAGARVPRPRPGAPAEAANPNLVIGVGGCVASQEGAAIVARAPYVDVVFGPQTLHRLPQLIADARRAGQVAGRHLLPRDREVRPSAAGPRRGGVGLRLDHGGLQQVLFLLHRALHARRRGLAPLRRRADRSRGPGGAGRQEVTLLGQNVNAYRGAIGRGSGQEPPAKKPADLALLIEYIAEMPGIERIRYTTSHPREVSQRLIDVYATVPKLVSHLHLPVQSGSDRVLAAMKRGYTALEYKSLVRKLRAARPDLSLSSDFIVGFPGETDDDFEKTMKLIDDVGFDASFSFLYSAAPRHAGGRTRRRHAAGGQARTPDAPAEAHRRTGAGRQRRPWSAACSACWSKGAVEEGRERTGRAHRQQPRRQLCRRSRRLINTASSIASIDVRITSAMPHSLRGEIVS